MPTEPGPSLLCHHKQPLTLSCPTSNVHKGQGFGQQRQTSVRTYRQQGFLSSFCGLAHLFQIAVVAYQQRWVLSSPGVIATWAIVSGEPHPRRLTQLLEDQSAQRHCVWCFMKCPLYPDRPHAPASASPKAWIAGMCPSAPRASAS